MSGRPIDWRIEPLDRRRHDRSAFSCGAPDLDHYIRALATQDLRRDLSRIFVALALGNQTVAGYYSLSATSFAKDTLPEAQARKLPHYPVPAALLGRLAVDEQWRGRDLGRHLLLDAIDRVHWASAALAVQALVVDARDEQAAAFYARFGFLRFQNNQRRLFLPLATIRRLIDG